MREKNETELFAELLDCSLHKLEKKENSYKLCLKSKEDNIGEKTDCYTKLFAELLDYAHLNLEKKENGYNLYRISEEDDINIEDEEDIDYYKDYLEDKNTVYATVTDIWKLIADDVIAAICYDLHIAAQKQDPCLLSDFQCELEYYSYDFCLEDWKNVMINMLKSSREEYHKFIEDNEKLFEFCCFIFFHSISNSEYINIDKAYEIQQANKANKANKANNT